jgi:hypothetical protein
VARDLPAGTRVEGIVGGNVARAATWNGPVVSLTPPALVGPAVTGEFVSVQPGTWSGGWDDDVDRAEVRACRTPDENPTGCRRLRAPKGRPAHLLLVDRDLAGFYLRAVNWRVPRDGGGTLLLRDPSTSPATPIVAGPPKVDLRRRVMKFSRGYGVGYVRCHPTCSVTVIVNGKRNASHTFTAGGRRLIVLPRSARLRPGLLRVRVVVDGNLRADGFVRLVR